MAAIPARGVKKNRVITPISISAKRKAAELMVIESQNVDILNKPYLSVAQEEAYNSVVEKVPHIPYSVAHKSNKKFWDALEELPPNVTTEHLLEDLNFHKKWE